jgi:uncharacterized protein
VSRVILQRCDRGKSGLPAERERKMCKLIRTGVGAVVLSLALLSFICAAYSATFNCNAKLTTVQSMICYTPELSNLDDDLADKYQTVLRAYPGERETIRRAQRNWLQARDRCRDVGCVEALYNARIAEMWKYRRQMMPGCTEGLSACTIQLW